MKLFLKLRKRRRRPAEAPPNGLTRKSASADRPGPGFCPGKTGKALEGAGAAQAARRSVSEMSQTSKQRRRPAEACRSRLAPERGCHEVTGVEKNALAAQAQGLGDMPGTKTLPNGLTKKSASADRPGPGFCPGKIGKALEGAGARGYAPYKKCSSEHRRGRGTLLCKVGKRLERRRGRTSGAAERQRDVADIEAAETPGEGLPSRLAPERGCHEVTGVEMVRLRSKLNFAEQS